jgi:hypothetical protein
MQGFKEAVVLPVSTSELAEASAGGKNRRSLYTAYPKPALAETPGR